MNFFGIHFCQDEAYAILTGLAFAAPITAWIRTKIWAFRYWRADRKARQSAKYSGFSETR